MASYSDPMGIFREKSSEELESVEVVVAGNGVVLQGSPSAVTVLADRINGLTKGVGTRRVLADGLAVAGHISALGNTYREYIEFSPRGRQLLAEHTPIPTGDGYFRSFVRSGTAKNSPFAGHLDWKPVDLGPERALAMQTAAMNLALRAAIKQVADAVERVEGKVDKLVALARAERLGNAVGDLHTLRQLADRTRQSGRIGSTDWSTVDGLGPMIARDLAALRAYVISEASEADRSWSAYRRSGELKELTDDLIKETLALLVLAEQNYVLWQELRVANVATQEPQLLEQVNRDVSAQLASMAEEDQKVIEALHAAASGLLEPTGYEGFALLARRRMKEHARMLNEHLLWFAEQRQLTAPTLEAELPTLRESIDRARGAVASGADVVGSKVKSVLHGRDDGDRPDELSPTG